MIAVWASFVGGANPGGLQDPQSDAVAEANNLAGGERIASLLALLDAELALEPAIVKLVEDSARALNAQRCLLARRRRVLLPRNFARLLERPRLSILFDILAVLR